VVCPHLDLLPLLHCCLSELLQSQAPFAAAAAAMDFNTFDDQSAHAEVELVSEPDDKRITRQKRGHWLGQQQEQLEQQPPVRQIKRLKQLMIKVHGEG
jgi:hypothetical protein